VIRPIITSKRLFSSSPHYFKEKIVIHISIRSIVNWVVTFPAGCFLLLNVLKVKTAIVLRFYNLTKKMNFPTELDLLARTKHVTSFLSSHSQLYPCITNATGRITNTKEKAKKGEDGGKEEFTDTNCDSGSRQMLKEKKTNTDKSYTNEILMYS